MSAFLFRLGRRCARHPWRVFGVWLAIAAVVLGVNAQLGGTTKDNFAVPGVEAQRANDLLVANFPQFARLSGQLVFHVEEGSITDPANVAAIERALAEVRSGEDVTAASDPFDPAGPTVSADGTTGGIDGDEGCNCKSDGNGSRGAPLLLLLALAGLRRPRRRLG